MHPLHPCHIRWRMAGGPSCLLRFPSTSTASDNVYDKAQGSLARLCLYFIAISDTFDIAMKLVSGVSLCDPRFICGQRICSFDRSLMICVHTSHMYSYSGSGCVTTGDWWTYYLRRQRCPRRRQIGPVQAFLYFFFPNAQVICAT
jgi:hypothetical protein